MNNLRSFLFKDIVIILSIILVFLLVLLVLFTEISKKHKIYNSKNNFYVVKEELLNALKQCNEKKEAQNWVFGYSCQQEPTIENILNYFNEIKKLINPHDGQKGVGGSAGSVQIDIKKNILLLSIDLDANGNIDTKHKILF